MDKTVFLLLSFAFITNMYTQELKLGDSIYEYANQNMDKYNALSDGGNFNVWSDINIFYSYNDKLYVLALVSYRQKGIAGKFFAALLGRSPNAYFLIDTDNDGILDKESQNLIIPFWIVVPPSTSSEDKDVEELLENHYISFQDTLGPDGPNGRLRKSLEKIAYAAKNYNTVNRDIYYIFQWYIMYNQDYPDVALKCITYLKDIFKERFGYVHIVLHLYHIETLINLRQFDRARQLLDEVAKDTDFIPLKGYSYLLEDDKEEKEKKRKELEEKYSDHWMIKEVLEFEGYEE